MRKKKRGAALVIVVLTMSILFILGTTMLSVANFSYKSRIRESNRIRNLYGADSGVNVVENIITLTCEKAIDYGRKDIKSSIEDISKSELEINNEFNNEAFNYQKDVCSPINSNNNTLDINSINNLNNQQNNITYIQPITVTDENTSEFKKHEENSIYSSPYVNKILKICILILGLIIFSPIFTSIAGMLMGLLGIALSILFGSIGLLIGGTFTSLVNSPEIPQFIANFPYPVLILFSLGSICISILLGIIFYYSCKFFLKLFLRLFRFFKSKV